MDKNSVRETGGRYKEAAIDRIDHCVDKISAIQCIRFNELSDKAESGIYFLLRDIASDLGEIKDELLAKKKMG